MGQVNLSTMFMNTATNVNASNCVAKANNNDSGNAFSSTLNKAKSTSEASNKRVDSKSNKEAASKKADNKETNTVHNDKKVSKQSNMASDTQKVEKSSNKVDKNQVTDQDEMTITKEVATEEVDETTKLVATPDQMAEQIVALVSQALQIPVEEVSDLLQTLGLSVEDLMTQEGFSEFISEAMAGGDMNKLLTGDLDLKQINQLFETISAMQDVSEPALQEEHSVLHILSQIQEPQEVLAKEQEVQSPIQPVNVEAAEENAAILTQMTPEKNERYMQQDEPLVQTDSLLMGEQVAGAEDIGITVPIHHFTSTQTQTYQTADGTVTQLSVTKQTQGSNFVLEQVDFKVLGQTKELSVQLSPKELGTMNIKIVEHNGVLVAEIKVENEKTKEFMLNEVTTLKENLEEQGLNVAEVKVDIRQNDARSQMEQEKQKSSKRIQEIIAQQFGEEEIEEETTVTDSESEVDYKI